MINQPAKLRYKKRNSLLYKSKVEYAQWCVNHIENCAHGCKFPCYAMMMAKRFGKIKNHEDWLCPVLVENAIELLEKEIPRYKNKIDFVHLCFMTDPFMVGYPEIEQMTLKIIEKLNQNDLKATVLTKGIFPKELKNTEKYDVQNEYGITLVSLNEQFRKDFETNTATYKARIKALKKLKLAGLKTWISIEPFPTPNLDKEQDLVELLMAVCFVDKIIFGKLNYNVESSQFGGSSSFYEECAQKVVNFCEKNNIEYHIKFGTQKEYNKTTEKVFTDRNSHEKGSSPLLTA